MAGHRNRILAWRVWTPVWETCSAGEGSGVGLSSNLERYGQESEPQEHSVAEHRLVKDGNEHWAACLIWERFNMCS